MSDIVGNISRLYMRICRHSISHERLVASVVLCSTKATGCREFKPLESPDVKLNYITYV